MQVRTYFGAAMAVVAVVSSAVHAQAQVANAVSGQVRDDKGAPIAGAEVTARYQSNPGGVSITRSAPTDRQGRYRIDLSRLPGVWTVHAKAVVTVDGSDMVLDLTPDSDAPFAGRTGAVRNFSLRYAEQTAENPYGNGAMLVVASAIGDYTPLDEVVVTLHPVDGGAPIERKLRSTGEGWVVTGLPPQTYRVTARHGGRPLLISPALTPQDDYRWGREYVDGFQRTGPGIYQMRIEVKRP